MNAENSDPDDRPFGTPTGRHCTRVLLLGSGELGKEITISLMRLGAWVCAADRYADAPAAQAAHESRVLNMADAHALHALIADVKPDIIVPEIEAIATGELADAAHRGIQVAPSSRIAAICMNRERLRVLAHEKLRLPTTPYRFAGTADELRAGAQEVGYPCVVKPIMSSSGHGQSVVTDPTAIAAAWLEAPRGRRNASEGGVYRVIVERFGLREKNRTMTIPTPTAGVVICPPIGQRQSRGDYQESWQPARVDAAVMHTARLLAERVVSGLVGEARKDGERGWGVFGVELFVLRDGTVLFNEVSPRPHDTGMVTMVSQPLNEFELHARAVLGVPVAGEDIHCRPGTVAASRAIIVTGEGEARFTGLPRALAEPGCDLRIFGKPAVHGRRRMGVALALAGSGQAARAKTARIVNGLSAHVAPAGM